ncbi:Uncharacterised protein [Raoultella terrigena]|nr:Uncharacterised protein [Raoultella terrigena]
MLNDLVLSIEAENINYRTGYSRFAAGGGNVQHNVVSVDNHPLNFAVRVREFFFQKGDELAKPFGTVFCSRVVLDILITEVGPGSIKVFIIQCLIIKSDDVFFVL